jgi:hypothetical protein
MAGRASLPWRGIRRFRSNCKPNRGLRIDDLSGALFGIGNRNHHDRKSPFKERKKPLASLSAKAKHAA